MPVYNGKAVIFDALNSIDKQNYKNYHVFIQDDASNDDLFKSFQSKKIKKITYEKNKKNLGYGNNMERLRKKIPKDTDIVFLMAQDDFIAKNTFAEVNKVFKKYPKVGALIRPFFMFGDDITTPIRDFGPFDRSKNRIIHVDDSEEALLSIIQTVCQLSGLAYRYSLLKTPFHEHVMTSHIYPFMEIFKQHPIMFLKNYTIAVRTYTSQTRHVPKIYEYSPQEEWGLMVRTVFADKKYQKAREVYLKFVYENFVSFVQLKNFSTTKILLREYWIFLKNRPQNIFNPKYWFFVLGTFIIPKELLLPLVDFFKESILSQLLRNRNIKFNKAT